MNTFKFFLISLLSATAIYFLPNDALKVAMIFNLFVLFLAFLFHLAIKNVTKSPEVKKETFTTQFFENKN